MRHRPEPPSRPPGTGRRRAPRCPVIPRRAAQAFALLCLLCATPTEAEPLAPNTITVQERSGEAQGNRVVSVARPLRRGEIPDCVSASWNGALLLTQCDVKNRWPDGSVKFAIVTFVIPRLPAYASAVIEFGNRATNPETSGLTQEAMLGPDYDFDATIELIGAGVTRRVSARAMLAVGHWRYWLKGPVVTASSWTTVRRRGPTTPTLATAAKPCIRYSRPGSSRPTDPSTSATRSRTPGWAATRPGGCEISRTVWS